MRRVARARRVAGSSSPAPTPIPLTSARAQVFIGPPFHSLPLAEYVYYASFSVFFNVTQPTWAEPSQIKWSLDMSERALHPTDSDFWVPDIADIQTRRRPRSLPRTGRHHAGCECKDGARFRCDAQAHAAGRVRREVARWALRRPCLSGAQCHCMTRVLPPRKGPRAPGLYVWVPCPGAARRTRMKRVHPTRGGAAGAAGAHARLAAGAASSHPGRALAQDIVIPIKRAGDMIKVLRAMPAEELARRQAALRAARSRFFYMPLPHSRSATGADTLAQHMCRRAGRAPPPDAAAHRPTAAGREGGHA